MLLLMLHIELLSLFAFGYLAIIFERALRINKAAVALLMAVLCWFVYFASSRALFSLHILQEQIYDVAQIIFFLLSVMVIVELIDSHEGFKMVTDLIYTSSKRKMFWFLLLVAFFMSSVLDNLTSMIVIASLLRKMVPHKEDRWIMGSIIIIAVNAGGAWTPIGDVTTTMLWINGRITTWETIYFLFLPSLVNALVAGGIGMLFLRGDHSQKAGRLSHAPLQPGAKRVFFFGLASIILIPFWKAALGIPPFMGALLGLGLLWLVTDIIHRKYGEERWHLRVLHVMTKIDMSGLLFFLGILLAIDALQMAGLLKVFAESLSKLISNEALLVSLIGLISAVIDNVPLVAGAMGMYDLQQYGVDHPFWQLLAYAAGTGGSILIIGSAAGVVYMGMEKIDFLWYLKKISWIALLSYLAGIATYLLLYPVLQGG